MDTVTVEERGRRPKLWRVAKTRSGLEAKLAIDELIDLLDAWFDYRVVSSICTKWCERIGSLSWMEAGSGRLKIQKMSVKVRCDWF